MTEGRRTYLMSATVIWTWCLLSIEYSKWWLFLLVVICQGFFIGPVRDSSPVYKLIQVMILYLDTYGTILSFSDFP